MNMFRHISTIRARKAASHEIDPEDVFLDSQNLSSLNIDQMEGHFERPLGRHVFYLFVFGIIFLLGAYSSRLFSMQVVKGESYANKADNNHLKKIPLFALRGTISDRNGELLAWNTLGNYIYKDTASSSTEKVSVDDIPMRVYTDTNGFSHLLGYVSYPKRDASGVFWQDEYIGKDGVEKEYQTALQGVSGERVIAINALHQVEAENVVVYPTHGANLQLSVDKNIQKKLYSGIEDLAKKAGFVSGAGIIMDVRSGEILAITSYPEYDNNMMTNAKSKEENKKVAEDLLDKRRKFLNRAVSGLFTPGSTVKVYIALAALMEKVITPEQNIYSSGKLVIKNKYGGPDTVFKDWKAHGYTDMRKAIEQSSDEYFYQVGGGYKDQKGLGIERINTYARMFGFGTTTGIDLPGEEHGTIPSPEWKKKIFKEDWLVGNTYHTSIGQYGFQLTALELVRGVASIANNGYLITPHVLKGLVTASTSLNLPQKDLRVIQEGMYRVVHGANGTGKPLDVGGIEIAAKSGTAELGVSKELVNSLITGYFPYDNPKYAFVVVMEKADRHNTFGAAHAMKDVLRYMRDETDYLDGKGKRKKEEIKSDTKKGEATSTAEVQSISTTTEVIFSEGR
jgi:penicillin-binding protein 2